MSAWGGWGKKRGVEDVTEKLRLGTNAPTLLLSPSLRDLSGGGAANFFAALGENDTLKELFISGHTIDPAPLAAALASNNTLRVLAFGDKNLGDDGVQRFCDAWANTALETLDLSFKSIGAKGCESLAAMLSRSGLRRVFLDRNCIDDVGAKNLFVGISRCSSLLEVRLGSNKITGEGVRNAAELLHMSSHRLESIDFSGNPIGDDGAAVLADLLGHHSNPAGSLKYLNLCKCGIGDSGAIKLLRAVAANSSSIAGLVLDLSGNAITGAAGAAAGSAIGSGCLQSLLLAENALSWGGIKSMAEAAASGGRSVHLAALDLSQNGIDAGIDASNSECLRSLVRCVRAKTLSLLGNALGGDMVFAIAEELRDSNDVIETLSLAGTGLSGACVSKILPLFGSPQHPSLRVLELGGNQLGEEGETAVRALKAANPLLDVAKDKIDGKAK